MPQHQCTTYLHAYAGWLGSPNQNFFHLSPPFGAHPKQGLAIAAFFLLGWSGKPLLTAPRQRHVQTPLRNLSQLLQRLRVAVLNGLSSLCCIRRCPVLVRHRLELCNEVLQDRLVLWYQARRIRGYGVSGRATCRREDVSRLRREDVGCGCVQTQTRVPNFNKFAASPARKKKNKNIGNAVNLNKVAIGLRIGLFRDGLRAVKYCATGMRVCLLEIFFLKYFVV